MYIKDYPYARIVEEARVLDCLMIFSNPLTREKKYSEKFIGTYQVMTEEGSVHKLHLKPEEELIIQSFEGEEKGTWWIERKLPKKKKDTKYKSILGITLKFGGTTQKYLCAFYHENGVIMLIPTKGEVYSFDREDYDFSNCLFLVKESLRTGQLSCKTIEEVYAFVKAATIRKMEDEKIREVAVAKIDKAIYVGLYILNYGAIFFVFIWSSWFSKAHMERPFFGFTESPPFWLYILWLVAIPFAGVGPEIWYADIIKKRISEFRQTRPNEIPDVSERWKV